jgi:N-acetylmuramoyl-L-alanine amidase
MVIDPRLGGACFLALLLAGCGTTASRRADDRMPDWQNRPGSAPITSFGAPKAESAPQPTPLPPAPPVGNVVVRKLLTNSIAGSWIPLDRWCLANGLPAPARTVLAGTTVVTLRAPAGDFTLRTGSQRAFWRGLEFGLGFAPQLINNQPFIHTLDLAKTVQPLLNNAAMPMRPNTPVIVIDPGHGGADPGARSLQGGSLEKDYTLDWGIRLASLMASNGWRVWLTRTNDIDLPISNRVAFAEQKKADIFLSLHFNSAPDDRSQEGLETYCLTPAGLPSNLTRGYGDDLHIAYPNNAYDEQNLLLAARVHKALLDSSSAHDRGIRRARFLGVLRGQQRPAVLVEGGYLSNAREARLIASSDHRQKLADAVAQALLDREAPRAQAMIPAGNSEASRVPGELAQAVPATGSQSSTNPGTGSAGWHPASAAK